MKNKILLSVLIVFLLGGGWYTSITGLLEEESEFEYYHNLASKKAENGLFEEAIENFNIALNYKQAEAIVSELVKAAADFYSSEGDTTSLNNYLNALSTAIELEPENPDYWETSIELFIDQNNFDKALELCKSAYQNGIENEKMMELIKEVKYHYDVDTTYKSDYLDACNGYYMVAVGDMWKWCMDDASKESKEIYAKVGYVGDQGIFLCEDVNGEVYFVDTDKVKRGVVKEVPIYFGLYSEGYCNVGFEDHYSLIDLYGEELIGNLSYCGSFQAGYAVIQSKEGKWGLVSTSGATKSVNVDEIKHDAIGRYTFSDTAIVLKEGRYYFYDSMLDQAKNDFSCIDIDVLTEDGMVAFQGDNGLWGFVELDGSIIIEPQYEAAKSFSNGVAAVCVDGLWGYINPENEMVVECTYFNCGYLSDGGVALVSDQRDNYTFLKFRFSDIF